jgi:hypothetical protein
MSFMLFRKNIAPKLILFVAMFTMLTVRSQHQVNMDGWKSPHRMEILTSAPAALIPFPREAAWTSERWVLPRDIVIAVPLSDHDITSVAVRSLTELLAGLSVKSRVATYEEGRTMPVNALVMTRADANGISSEGYRLKVSREGVMIQARDASGFYFAVQTIRQLILQAGGSRYLPGCRIYDWPAFPLRGLMHDNGRNFQSISLLKAQLDRLSWYKFNTFHWHLTDNPAWRSQSRRYPQLNDPRNREAGRDPDSTYSFDDIRELIRYARERGITIIPELDMPGHSKYFEPTFGFKMETEQGMKVLENLIDEFCQEIPAADCPIIHIGSDEVRIPNPKEFIRRMTDKVLANKRRVMVWNPGLPPSAGTIEQLWREDNTKGLRTSSNPYVDSYFGYLNNYDVYSLVQRYFFQQICNRAVGDTSALGGIVCLWPDVRVEDKSKIALHSALWPGALTYSEAAWCGRPGYDLTYINALPARGTAAFADFREFEGRLSKHRDRFFSDMHFPYVQFGNSEWILRGPYRRKPTDSAFQAFAPELDPANDTGRLLTITGGILQMSNRTDPKALSVVPDETVYLTGYIYSEAAREMHAVLGFEAAARSNRRSGGIPQNGKWDANGGAVFINGRELPGPKWSNPGGHRYLNATWYLPPNEIPYTDEEFYWSRPPARIRLQQGWNEILVRMPRAYRDQRWHFAFAPVRQDQQGKWVEDPSIRITSSKK